MGTTIQLAYLAAAVLFILGLRNLSSAKTAPLGNKLAAVGMAVAIVATLVGQGVVGWSVILAGVVVGSAIGAVLAQRIQMTAMPQMVALLNGFGGAASALVVSAELLRIDPAEAAELGITVQTWAIVVSTLIGAVTASPAPSSPSPSSRS